MNQEQQRFYRAITEMEQEGEVAPLEPALEDKLVGGVLKDLAQQRSRRRFLAAAAATAMAASLALFVGLQQPGGALPPYQAYAFADDNFLSSEPSAQTAEPRLGGDAMLRLELRPHDEVRDAAYAKTFLVQNGRLQPLDLPLTRTASGSFRVRKPVREVPELHPGRLELVFAIGRSAGGPKVDELERAYMNKKERTADGWQVLRQPLEIIP